MNDLSLPMLVSTAMYALREHGSYTSTVGAPPLIQRFVALKDLDDTTDDAVTWSRTGQGLAGIGKYALLVTAIDYDGPTFGNLIACDDPHRAFFTLMRMVYGDEYTPSPVARMVAR